MKMRPPPEGFRWEFRDYRVDPETGEKVVYRNGGYWPHLAPIEPPSDGKPDPVETSDSLEFAEATTAA